MENIFQLFADYLGTDALRAFRSSSGEDQFDYSRFHSEANQFVNQASSYEDALSRLLGLVEFDWYAEWDGYNAVNDLSSMTGLDTSPYRDQAEQIWRKNLGHFASKVATPGVDVVVAELPRNDYDTEGAFLDEVARLHRFAGEYGRKKAAQSTAPERRTVNGMTFLVWPYYDRAGKTVYQYGGLVKHPECGAQISYESLGPMESYMERHSTPGAFGACRLLKESKRKKAEALPTGPYRVEAQDAGSLGWTTYQRATAEEAQALALELWERAGLELRQIIVSGPEGEIQRLAKRKTALTDADFEMRELEDAARDQARTLGRTPFDPAVHGPLLRPFVEQAVYSMTSVFESVTDAADDYNFAADENAHAFAFDVAQAYERELRLQGLARRKTHRLLGRGDPGSATSGLVGPVVKMAAGDSPGQVNEEQSGHAESGVADYDTITPVTDEPMWSEDWDGEDDTGSQIGSEKPSEYPGAEGSNVDAETPDDLTKVEAFWMAAAQGQTLPDNGERFFSREEGLWQNLDKQEGRRASRKTATFTVGDIARLLDRPDHNGWGYASAHGLTGPQKAGLDEAVVTVANDLGLSEEELFIWLDSRPARHCLDDATFGGDPLEIVRKFLNQTQIDRLKSEWGMEAALTKKAIGVEDLQPGQRVYLEFDKDPENEYFNSEPEYEWATYKGRTGDRATFESVDGPTGNPYDWEAYLYDGRWCYGSGADPLNVLQVVSIKRKVSGGATRHQRTSMKATEKQIKFILSLADRKGLDITWMNAGWKRVGVPMSARNGRVVDYLANLTVREAANLIDRLQAL